MATMPREKKKQVNAIIEALVKAYCRDVPNVFEEQEQKGIKSLAEQRHPCMPGWIVSWSDYRVKIYYDDEKKCIVIKFLVGSSPRDQHTSPIMWPQTEDESSRTLDVKCICKRVNEEVVKSEDLKKKVVEMYKKDGEQDRYHSMKPRHCPCPKCNPRLKAKTETA